MAIYKTGTIDRSAAGSAGTAKTTVTERSGVVVTNAAVDTVLMSVHVPDNAHVAFEYVVVSHRQGTDTTYSYRHVAGTARADNVGAMLGLSLTDVGPAEVAADGAMTTDYGTANTISIRGTPGTANSTIWSVWCRAIISANGM